jgi:protease II
VSSPFTSCSFDDPAYVTWLAYNPEPETSRLRYGYSSMTTPDTAADCSLYENGRDGRPARPGLRRHRGRSPTGARSGIAFDDPAYVTWLAYNPEPETSRLRYGYSSMTTQP